MTLKTQMTADVSTVFLNTDDFATSARRLIAGETCNIELFTVMADDDMPAREHDRGRGYSHTRSIWFASTQTLLTDDAVYVDSVRYEVDSIGDAQDGMRQAKLIRYEPETRGAKPVRTGGL